jgi:hypothetical protein
METSQLSQLPDYNVTVFNMIEDERGSYDMLEVACPRCQATFWVGRIWAVIRAVTGRDDDPPSYPHGRPCPHCSRASAIPEDLRVYDRPDDKPKPKARYIVRRKRS